MREQRYAYVDLIRGLAALTVLVAHYRWFFVTEPGVWPPGPADYLPWYSFLWLIYEHGGIAVQMFWLLSGFVFTVAYGKFGRDVSARDFWAARFARLYPLHFLTLLIVASLQIVSIQLHGQPQVYENNDLPHFIAQLFFASNWFTSEGSFNAPIWTVSVEVLVYFAFFVALKLFGNNIFVASGLAALSFAAERITKNPIAFCAALFFGGVIIGNLAPVVQSRLGRWSIALGLMGCLAAAGLLWVGLALGAGPRASVVVIYVGLPAFLFTFIALDANLKPLPRSLRWVGEITYSVYLLHMPILIAAKLLFPTELADPDNLHQPALLVAFVATVIVASLLSYRFFELPMQKWLRNRFATASEARDRKAPEALQAAP